MSVATMATTSNITQALNLPPPFPDESPPPQLAGESLCVRDVPTENEVQSEGASTSGRVGDDQITYQNMATPSMEILGIFRRNYPGEALNPVTYPIAAPSTTRQWHPALVLPSHMRYMQAVAACLRVRSSLQPVIAVRPSDYSSGPPMGQAAPAA